MLTQQWTKAIESNIARTWVVFYVKEPVVVARVREEMKTVVTTQTERLKRLNELVAGDAEAVRMVAEISKMRDQYQAARNGLLKRQEAGEDVARELNETFYPLAKAYLASIEKVAEYQGQRSATHRSEAEAAARQVQEVADLIGRISAATQEQTEGLAHVDDAVQQLDQVTQQNAALVEESAAAAESLKQQAQRLVGAVGVFRVEGRLTTAHKKRAASLRPFKRFSVPQP